MCSDGLPCLPIYVGLLRFTPNYLGAALPERPCMRAVFCW